MTRNMRCCHCRKRIYKQRNGAWYHEHNGSVACYPGDNRDRKATPSLIMGASAWREAGR